MRKAAFGRPFCVLSFAMTAMALR